MFSNTRLALDEYDKRRAIRNRAVIKFYNAADDELCTRSHELQKLIQLDTEMVQRAYYEDTKKYNTLQECLATKVSDIKREVEWCYA